MDAQKTREMVKESYGKIARESTSCCGSTTPGRDTGNKGGGNPCCGTSATMADAGTPLQFRADGCEGDPSA